MKGGSSSSDVYFALRPTGAIGAALLELVRSHYQSGKTSARTKIIRKAAAASVGGTVNGSGAVSWDIIEGGEQGELLHSVENHFRSVGINLLNLITAQRPQIQCGAANTDKRSLSQTLLGNGLVDYHLTERRLETLLKKAGKLAIFQTEGFIEAGWDVHAGDDYAPEPEAFMDSLGPDMAGVGVESPGGEIQQGSASDTLGPQIGRAGAPTSLGPVPVQKAGEPIFCVLGPLDVIRDEYAPSWESLPWLITRKWVSKHELAARYPEKQSILSGLQTRDELDLRVFGVSTASKEYTDLVPVFTFYHERTVAVPEGRLTIFLDDETVLSDGPNPYKPTPVFRIVCDEMDGTPFGWSPLMDALGPQDVVNAIDTSIVSNELGRGIGNILVPDGADVQVEELSSSMNAVNYKGAQKPEPLAWPATPPEFFAYKREKISAIEVLAGLNSVVRGNPSESVGADASGAKLALLQAIAIQNNSGLEKSWVDLVRDVALCVIHLYRDFGGNVPRLARIAGKQNAYLLKEFVAEDLEDIDRVKVDVGDPIMRTTTGKMAVADKAVELGIIKPGELQKYILLLKEGTVEPLFEAEQAAQMLVRGENERLMEGQPHVPILSDAHWVHIPEHLALLDNPAMREPGSEAIQEGVLGAVQQHLDLFAQMPPTLVLFRGGAEALSMWQQIQALQAPPLPPGGSQTPMPAPGEPSGTPPPEPGVPTSTPPPAGGAAAAFNPEGSKPQMAGLPNVAQPPSVDGAQVVQ